MKISLIGYMGSGKSEIGKMLSDALKIKHIDLDNYIEQQEGSSIKDIFSQYGEIHFRKLESSCLSEILALDDFVLSTGGGTPVFYNHMDALTQATNVYYLHASPIELAKRLSPEKKKRPLISHIADADLPEYIAKHLFERNPYYQQAQHTIHTTGKSLEDVVEEIKTLQSRS